MAKNNNRTLQLLHFISLIPAFFPAIIFYPYDGPIPAFQILIFVIGVIALIFRYKKLPHARTLILIYSTSFLFVLMAKFHFRLWEGVADGWIEKLIWQVKQVEVLFILKKWPHMFAFLLEWFSAPMILIIMFITEVRSYWKRID